MYVVVTHQLLQSHNRTKLRRSRVRERTSICASGVLVAVLFPLYELGLEALTVVFGRAASRRLWVLSSTKYSECCTN